jgi:FkbM family methyltransferase
MRNPSNPVHKYYENIIKTIKHIPVIFELGACDGSDSIDMIEILSRYHKVYRYFAFEMDTRLKNKLDKIVSKMVTVIYKAIGNKNDIVECRLAQGKYYGSSTIKKPDKLLEHWPDMKYTMFSVPCCRLDTFCSQNNVSYIDFIYADVEGAEIEMIQGGINIFKNTKYLYTEHLDSIYEGNISTKKILEEIRKSGDWSIVEDFGADVLMKNNKGM